MNEENIEKKNIAVVGDDEFTLGFKLAGVQKVFNTEDYRETVEKLIDREDIGIVVAEQKDIKQLPGNVRRRVEGSVDPVVVSLSEEGEASGIQDKIKKVIGVDLS